MGKSREDSNTIVEAAAEILRGDQCATLVTIISGSESPGAKLLVNENGQIQGDLGSAALNQAVALFSGQFLSTRINTRIIKTAEFAPALSEWHQTEFLFERIEPEPRIVICGAGHVGAALARLARFTGFTTILIDDRPEFLTRIRFTDEKLELVATDDWGEALEQAIGNGRGVSVAIVTRGHDQDEKCLMSVAKCRPDYIGLIGSKRRTNIVLENALKSGAETEVLHQVRAPIGLDIRAVTPEEVAVSIMAEIIAFRRGGAGGSMSEWRRLV